MTFSEVAMAGNGDVIAVWTQSTGGMWASIRPAGGSFGAPVPISSGTGAVGSGRPALAVDAAGNAIATWTQSDGSNPRTRAAFRPAGGSFGPMETISAAGTGTRDLDLAMDAAGNAIAVWSTAAAPNRVQWSYRPAGGSFPPGGTTITAGATSSQQYPRLAMDAAGNAVVAYQAYDTPPNVTYIRYQERPAGGVFPGAAGEKEVLLENGNGSPPSDRQMDVGIGGGQLAFAWHRFEGGSNDTYRGAFRTFGAAETTGTHLIDSAESMSRIQLVMAPSGEALAVWSTSGAATDLLWSARTPGSATFGPPAHLAPEAAIAQEGVVGLDGLGNAMATWYQVTTPPAAHTAWAARRPAGGSFGAPQELFGGGAGIFFSNLSAGGDSQGNGFVGAARFASPNTRLNVAGWDPVPPALGALTVPPVSNNPISFSVTPSDVWGPVTTGWDFGDGATAPGTQQSHTFGTPGQNYNVTATATDAAGNSASASALTVLNAPPALGRLTMLRRVFAVAGSPTAISAQRGRRVKRGTTFRYSLSEPARVTIRIDRILPGRRVGRRCRKPSPRLIRRPSCKRYVRAGRTLVRNPPVGRVATKFSGRIGRRALRPGRYRATAEATDRFDLRSRKRTITFRVARG